MKYSKKGLLKTWHNKTLIASTEVKESSFDVEDLLHETTTQVVEIHSRAPIHGVYQSLSWDEEITEIADFPEKRWDNVESDTRFLVRWATITQREGEDHHSLTSITRVCAKGKTVSELEEEVDRVSQNTMINNQSTHLGHVNFERVIGWDKAIWNVIEIPDE